MLVETTCRKIQLSFSHSFLKKIENLQGHKILNSKKFNLSKKTQSSDLHDVRHQQETLSFDKESFVCTSASSSATAALAQENNR